MESISVGCVSMSQRHFPKGKITAGAFRSTSDNTLMELHPVLSRYTSAEWQEVVGCSGTIKAIGQTCRALGYSEGEGDGFSAEALDKLAEHMCSAGDVDKLGYDLAERRLSVLAGGVAVLQALFNALQIEYMHVSSTALREGVIYDLHGREHHADVQQSTLRRLSKQFSVDTAQATRVRRSAEYLQQKTADASPLSDASIEQMLFAAQLYELGWLIAHSQYHKHGHYLLANLDMRGFSNTEQQLLANLVRYHRRKLPLPLEKTFTASQQQCLLFLRLAVIINRDRTDRPAPPIDISLSDDGIELIADPAWLEQNPLTATELQTECQEWARAGLNMTLNGEREK